MHKAGLSIKKQLENFCYTGLQQFNKIFTSPSKIRDCQKYGMMQLQAENALRQGTFHSKDTASFKFSCLSLNEANNSKGVLLKHKP